MIYDHLDREIGLEGVLNDDFKNLGSASKKSWSNFHQNYVSQVGRIVGFKRPQLEKEKLTKPERRVFERLYKEYHEQKILPELFGSYENFFHCFFVAPYGLEYSSAQGTAQGKYADALPCLEERLQEKKSRVKEERDKDISNKDIINQLGEEISTIKKEISIINFARKIDLPALLYECLNSHGKNVPKGKFKEIRISCSTSSDSGEQISTILKPEFGSNLWEDVLVADNNDCLFVNLSRDEKGKYNVKFQEYWLASFLHVLHPKIHYLNFRTPSDTLPSPLLKVKLMEAGSEKEGKYLVVGGVLGGNFKIIKTKGIEEFVDQSVRELFRRNYSKKDRLLYNFSHVPGEEKPYNQFVEFVKRKYSVSEEKLKSIGTAGGKECTHRLKIGWGQEAISRISNVDEEGEDKFRGEQYSETFEPNREKGAVGAFTALDGLVQGFDLSYRQVKSAWKRKLAYTLLAGFSIIAFDSCANYFGMLIDQEMRVKEYSIATIKWGDESNGFQRVFQEEKRKVVVGDLRDIGEPEIKSMEIEEILTEMMHGFKSLCDSVSVESSSAKLAGSSVDQLVCPSEGEESSYLPSGLDLKTWTILCPYNIMSVINNETFYRGRKKRGEPVETRLEVVAIPLFEVSKVKEIMIEGEPMFLPSIPFLYQPLLVQYFEPALEITTENGKKYFINGSAGVGWVAKVLKVSELASILNTFVKQKNDIHFGDLADAPEWYKKKHGITETGSLTCETDISTSPDKENQLGTQLMAP